jgi:signal transduction histidine kinase
MHKDGSRLYVDLSFSVLKNASGTIVGALAVARDCTARYLSDKSRQARVVELEAKLQAVSNLGSTPLPGK